MGCVGESLVSVKGQRSLGCVSEDQMWILQESESKPEAEEAERKFWMS